ncbi:unnamed protein product [Ceutorhynchus assimilis]|uniref:Receptor ligand binding region domain-containing protein n=1 Tax=Ceutorhynchus assimilis TaxID=467358 RepID=A0A9N9M9G8_9CUCU|nr:unnamed protein product [Ceutorhynchus assimilis]
MEGRRMRWSRALNTELMRAYYQVTKGETDVTGYRDKLEELWNAQHQQLILPAQRLADQVRSILRRKALSEAELDELKNDWRRESIRRSVRRSNVAPQAEANEEILKEQNQVFSEDLTEIQDLLKEIDLKFRGIPIQDRPALPKLTLNQEILTMVTKVNKALDEAILSETLLDICHAVYCAAHAVCSTYSAKLRNKKPQNKVTTENIPPWQRRIENKINTIRGQVGILHTYLNSESSRRVQKQAKNYARRAKINPRSPSFQQDLRKHLDDLKQKIKALGNRIRRYRLRCRRYQENKLFSRDQKAFYRQLQQNTDNTTQISPEKEHMQTFWSDIWERNVTHNDGAFWIAQEETSHEATEQMVQPEIRKADVTTATNKLKNWTAPGVDHIHNYCISNIDGAEYHCNKTQVRKVISGVVGAASSVTSIQVANLLRLFKIPQVSFFSTSPELSNKQRFEYFSRTIPSDHHQVKAMVDIVMLMGWSYISIIYEESNYGIKAFEVLEDLLVKNKICIAVKEKLVKDSGVGNISVYDNIVQKLQTKPRAKGSNYSINVSLGNINAFQKRTLQIVNYRDADADAFA